ncbi:MAG: hypothetical protein IMY82_02505 [Chloroflexi bacterium]|nr:hypothetical protein [Chloroflexota bacterium]
MGYLHPHRSSALAVIGVLTSLLSLYYYLRPIIVLFLQGRSAYQLRSGCREEFVLLGGCVAALLVFGVYPGPLLELIALVLP